MGHCIPTNVIVDKVLLAIMKSQACKREYAQFKALPAADQDFAHVQTHLKAAKLLQKECQDTAEEHGYGMSAEDTVQDSMTKNMLNLANAINRGGNSKCRNRDGECH